MMYSYTEKKRIRKSFGKTSDVIQAPNLIDLQINSYNEFLGMIDGIFESRIKDGQLDECPLTFKELYAIKVSFTRTLLNMLHSRIEYPKDSEIESSQ